MYGGAARGGKSDALLMAAAQFVEVPGYSALLLRENFPDLNQADGLIPRSKQWWSNTEAKWHESSRRWTFPSGATITFGYLDGDNAVYQYQGAQFQTICIDELTQHTEFRYRYLFSRLSRPKDGPLSTVPLRMRSGTNPGGRGHEWVKKRFIDEKIKDPDAIFVPAKLEDNPSTDREEYEKSVANVDPLTRQQLRHGDWNAIEGGRFKRDWFRWYRRDGDFYLSPSWRFLPQHRPIFFTIDFASSAKQTADYTVCSVWMLSPSNDLVWLDCVRVQKETPDLVPLVQRLVRQYRPLFVGVEAVGSNNALLQFLQRSKDPVMTVMQLNPMGNDKLVRATPAMVRVSEGRIYLPEDNSLFPLEDVLSELCRFTGDAKKDGNDDICLVKGTMVSTINGELPIESVCVGDKVLTRSGWKCVTASAKTSPDAKVLKIELSNGRSLVGTPAHRVFVEGKGFVRIDRLTYADKIVVCENQPSQELKRQSLTGELIGDGLIQGIPLTECTFNYTIKAKKSRDTSIGMFGSILAARKYRKAMTSITSTGTHRTTHTKTLNVSTEKNIAKKILNEVRTKLKQLKKILTKYGILRQPGIGAIVVESGIGRTVKKAGRKKKRSRLFVFDAKSTLRQKIAKQSYVQMPVQPPFVDSQELTTNSGYAKSVPSLSWSEDIQKPRLALASVVAFQEAGRSEVYNLTVEDDHEYFANGVLTHNCDTLFYAAELLPRISNLDNSAVPFQHTLRGNLATGSRPASSLPTPSNRQLPIPKPKQFSHPLVPAPALPTTRRLPRSR